MGFFKSAEEKAAIAKAKEEARLEAQAKKEKEEAARKKAEAQRLAKQAEERRIKEAKDKATKHNENLTKTGINAKDVDPANFQRVLIQQNNVIMMYLENIAIMNSNLLNNPILATMKTLHNSRLAEFHKDYIDVDSIK